MATSGGMLTVKLIGDEELKRKLRSSTADVPVGRFLDRAAFKLQGNARKKAPVDEGALKNSIGVESPNNRLRRVGPSVDYGEYVELGTRPHWPPPGSLLGWGRRHGALTYSKDGTPSDYLIRRAIAKRGTKPNPYMQPAADELEGQIPVLVSVLAAEIESAFQ